jgi:hypothetical protein
LKPDEPPKLPPLYVGPGVPVPNPEVLGALAEDPLKKLGVELGAGLAAGVVGVAWSSGSSFGINI